MTTTGLLGASAVLTSDLPAAAGVPLALAAVLWGWHLSLREAAKPARPVAWDGHAGLVRVDGVVVADPRLAWRGALACLSWRDARGRRQHLVFWPDALDPARRRELRLAAGQAAATPGRASVAP